MELNNDMNEPIIVNNGSFLGFVSNEDMSSDLQKKLKRINKLPNGLYETKFKIDRYKFDRAIKNELSEMNSLQDLFQDIMTETGTQIMLHMKSKSNSKLRNPLVNVIGSLDGIEFAKEKILSVFENIKMRVVLKMDVSYKDHSHIIGRGGYSIQKVMDDTGSHIHFPDSNRISDVKKSNVVLVCGSPNGVEQARCKIRNLLPLVVHFKIPLDSMKRVTIESYSKHLRSIQQVYNVHVSIRYSQDIDEAYAAIFDSSRSSKYIAVSVRGANNDLAKLKESLSVLINHLTDFNVNLKVAYALTIEITEFYHQLVMGTNYFNVKNIMQQTGCMITFPDVETNLRTLDFDNLNEIPVNKSTVMIKGPSFDAVHQAWKELIGYLPLVLTFDLAHDQPLDTALLNQLKKQYKVAIFLKHKEKYNTVIIRGIERNSRALFEVRKQLLKLDDADVPICCEQHGGGKTNNSSSKFTEDIENNNLLNSIMNNNNLSNVLPANNNSNSILTSIINGSSNMKKVLHVDINNNALSSSDIYRVNNGQQSEKISNLANFNSSSNSSNEIQNIFNPMFFQAVINEQYQLLQQQQQLNQKQRHQTQQSLSNLILNTMNANNSNSNVFNNTNLTEEVSKLFRQQAYLDQVSSSVRGTHSVNDLSSIQTNANLTCDSSITQNSKKELTSSCSSPALHAINLSNANSNANLLNTNFNANRNFTTTTHQASNNTSATNVTNLIENVSSSNSNVTNNCENTNLPTSSPSNFNQTFVISNQANNNLMNNNVWPDQRKLTYDECRYLALKNTYEKPDANEVRIPSSIWSGLGFSKSMSHDVLKSKLIEWNPLLNSPTSTVNLNGAASIKQSNLMFSDLHNNNLEKNTNEANSYVWPEVDNIGLASGNTTKARTLIKQESEICSTSTPFLSSYLNNLLSENEANLIENQLLASNNTNTSNISNLNQSSVNQMNSKMYSTYSNSNNYSNGNGGNSSSGITFIDVDNIDLATVLMEYGLAKYIDTFKQFKISFTQFLSLTEDDLSKLGIQYVGRRKLYTAIVQLRKLLQSNLVGNNFNAKLTDHKKMLHLNNEIKFNKANQEIVTNSLSQIDFNKNSPTAAAITLPNQTSNLMKENNKTLSNFNLNQESANQELNENKLFNLKLNDLNRSKDIENLDLKFQTMCNLTSMENIKSKELNSNDIKMDVMENETNLKLSPTKNNFDSVKEENEDFLLIDNFNSNGKKKSIDNLEPIDCSLSYADENEKTRISCSENNVQTQSSNNLAEINHLQEVV